MPELDGKPIWPAVSVRDVGARDDGLPGADGQEAPLVLGRRVDERLGHRLERNPAEDADARVAGAAAEVPDSLVAECLELAQRQLAARRPDLLQADHIRLPLCDPPDKAATDGGPDAIHVQRDNVHGRDDASSVRERRRRGRVWRPAWPCRRIRESWLYVLFTARALTAILSQMRRSRRGGRGTLAVMLTLLVVIGAAGVVD